MRVFNWSRYLCGVAAVIVAVACGSSSKTGPETGTVGGVVADSLFGGIAAVSVVATPTGQRPLPSVMTDGSGSYAVTDVPAGAGTIAVSGLPQGCVTPSAVPFAGLASGGALTVNIGVSCPTAIGSVFGTVSNAYGFPEQGATVTVTPTGGTALPAATTDANGSYIVRSVPVGHGAVTVLHVGKGCTTPSAVSYQQLKPSDSVRADVAVPCPESTPLFVATEVGGLYGFSGALLGSSGSTLPSPVGVSDVNGPITAIAFDASGNLWAATESHYASDGMTALPGAVAEYPASQMVDGSNASPAVVVTFPTNGFMTLVSGMAFDNQGTLWIAGNDIGNNNAGLYGYSASQLTASGSPTPAHILDDAYLYATRGLAFDAAGNLWLQAEGSDRIVEYTPSQLMPATGAPTPTNTLLGVFHGNAQEPAGGLAFDASGNLWVASAFDSVVEVSAAALAQLGSNQAPSPSVRLVTSTPPTYASQLAFDLQANLWVLNISDGTSDQYGTPPTALLRFPVSALTGAGGAPDIAINLAAIPSAASGPSAMAFAPGAGLSLSGSARSNQKLTQPIGHVVKSRRQAR
ncbi:MAG TPA: hypothetical protein VFA43_00085 [Gemmatimonadaceae bacterium]|nr:hypothetical protein [Gemmatimonadaceae bacterium]